MSSPIKMAAIRLSTPKHPDPILIIGPNHGYCYESIGFECEANEITDRINANTEEGFVDITGRFLNREDAYNVAEENGQLISEVTCRSLQSYNVKYAH